MENIHLEKDIYPAISSGEIKRVDEAVAKLVQLVENSGTGADLLLRSFNWTWPLLTSKARATSEDGLAILTKFCTLLTKLILNCSDPLLPTVAGLKQVIRCVIRGLKSVDPAVSSEYLKSLTKRFLDKPHALKTIKGGFLFDKASMESFISIRETTEDEELASLTEDILTKVLESRLLYNQEVIVDFLVRIAKALNGSAASSRLIASVFESHRSREMYNNFMEKVRFLTPSASASTMTRLTNLNFFIDIVSANSPGEQLPCAITKSELTTTILNHKTNGLVAIFSLRLVTVVLNRLGRDFEIRTRPEIVVSIRDRLIELGSLLPVLQQYLAGPSDHKSLLFVYEIVKLVLAYKKSLPGSFSDFKFSWTKLFSSDLGPKKIAIVSKLVAELASSQIPITTHTVEAIDKIFEYAQEEGVETVLTFCRTNPIVSACFGSELDAWIKVLRKNDFSVREFFKFVLTEIVKNPQRLVDESQDETIVSRIAQLQGCPFGQLRAKVEKRMKRKRMDGEEEEIVDEEMNVGAKQDSVKRLGVSPYYDTAYASQSTQEFANSINLVGPNCVVNLIELVGPKIDQFFSSIMSLSSDDSNERDTAFQILAVVLRALALSLEAKEWGRFTFREAPQIAMILTWFRNGIPPPGDVLPIVPRRICVFVVEAIKILLNPKHDLYTVMYKFILSKPGINLESVVLWSPMFFGTDSTTCRIGRLWIMDVLVEAGDVDDPAVSKAGVTGQMMAAALHLNASEEEFDRAIRYMGNLGFSPELMEKYSICSWLSLVLRHSTKFLKQVV